MTDKSEEWIKELLLLADSTDEEHSKQTEKQKRILEAATDIFSKKGFSAASTSEIAQRAGVAEGTIFRHYKTKKDLLLALASPIAFKLVAPFVIRDFATKILDEPHERIEDLLRSIAKDRLIFARQHYKLLRILISEIPYQPELLKQVQTLFREIVYTRMEQIIVHYQEKGQLVDAPPWRILRTIISAFFGLIASRLLLLPDDTIDEDEEIEQTLQLIMHGLSKPEE